MCAAVGNGMSVRCCVTGPLFRYAHWLRFAGPLFRYAHWLRSAGPLFRYAQWLRFAGPLFGYAHWRRFATAESNVSVRYSTPGTSVHA